MGKKDKKEKPVDLFLLEKIHPQGGINFKDEKYIKLGDGYECCIHIYEFPQRISSNWLKTVCNIKDTVTTIDVSTEDIIEVKKNINKSLKEQHSRYMSATNFEDKLNAEQRIQEMTTLFKEIESYGEVMKVITIRIFISDRSWITLEDKVKKLMGILESSGYKSSIYLNEGKNEWTSMYHTYTEQQSNPFAVVGQTLGTHALAIGNPFHFSSLEDEYAMYLGYTPCGGNVLFDLFAKTLTRLYYNAICVGTMGSGKSTLLKKIFKDRAIRGDYVRTFDVSGEFTKLTKELGGKIIKLDGSSGMLNPLEILRAGENEGTNFTLHISKVSTIYKFLVPSAEATEVIDFTNVLRELYEKFGLNPESNNEKEQITGLPSKSYPIFSDMLSYVTEKMKMIAVQTYTEVESKVAEKNILSLENIRKTLENIVKTYGTLFNGHTSIDNVLDEQIVTFDISNLKNMDASIFDAQIFNMVSLCWDNCVTNGTIMNNLLNQKKIRFEDLVRFIIIIDESHRWINTQKIQALDLITVYLREARKYLGGIVLASQSIRDYVPDGSSDIALNKIKTVFELTQYKFIFHQDNNALGTLRKVFDNVLTESQLNRIPKLELGDNILCISGDKNLEFHVHITPDEEKIFSGGI